MKNIITIGSSILSSAVLTLLGVSAIITIPISVAIASSLFFYMSIRENKNNRIKKEEIEEDKPVKSLIQSSFESIESAVSSHVSQKDYTVQISAEAFDSLTNLKNTIYNLLNKTDKVVNNKSENRKSRKTTGGNEWNNVADLLFKLSTIISEDYLGKLLLYPELFDDVEKKLDDVAKAIEFNLKKIEEKNRELNKDDTFLIENQVQEILQQGDFVNVFKNENAANKMRNDI